MSYVTPAVPRGAVRETAAGLEFDLPAKQRVAPLLFLPLWLAGWAGGELAGARSIGSSDLGTALLTALWLAFWSYGGFVAGLGLLWILGGRERFTLRSDALAIRREVFGIGRTRSYDLARTRNLRTVAPTPTSAQRGLFFWVPGGAIGFDYGAATISCGLDIDAAEAAEVVRMFKARHRFAE